MRQIGIITLYHNNCNYGGALQAYALNQAVRELGYGCRTIDYVPTGMPLKEKLVRKRRTDGLTAAAAAAVKISCGKISARIGKAVDPEAAMEIRIRESNVAEFRKKRIPHTGPCRPRHGRRRSPHARDPSRGCDIEEQQADDRAGPSRRCLGRGRGPHRHGRHPRPVWGDGWDEVCRGPCGQDDVW